MNARVQKWGNSLALRLPASLAAQLGIHDHSVVDLEVVQGRLLITPVEQGPTLEELLQAIDAKNLQVEVETGQPQGKEEW